jgi:hypothetical protein
MLNIVLPVDSEAVAWPKIQPPDECVGCEQWSSPTTLLWLEPW